MGQSIKGGIRVFRNKGGYGSALLSKDSNKKEYSGHRLVAAAFLIQPKGKDQVNHKDGNKQNNNWWNLEWVTQEENNAHALANNLMPCRNKNGVYQSKNLEPRLTESDIREIKGNLNLCVRGLADRFKVRPKKIRAIARRLAGADTMLKPSHIKSDSNDIKYDYLCNSEYELPQKRCGNESGGHCGGVVKTEKFFEANEPRSPAGGEQKKPDFHNYQAQQIFSWEKEGSRGEVTIILPISNHPIRVEQLTINRSMDEIVEISDDMICTVDGCANPCFAVGYGRCARRCEHHHQERLKDGSRQRLVQVVYLTG
jgi:hypothetical protein